MSVYDVDVQETEVNNFDKLLTKYILCSMNTVISVKVDQEVKDEAQALAKGVGLTLSSLVNSYLRQIIVTRRIELFAPEPMTPRLEAMITQVEAEIATGDVSESFDNVDDFITALNS